mmetsp:Transcript_21322/g.43871  ORF Transcript_21322/g.43871 Transcript_21322/m.43871 type:complete len:248 (+) Transcript_21322:65-808(+)
MPKTILILILLFSLFVVISVVLLAILILPAAGARMRLLARRLLGRLRRSVVTTIVVVIGMGRLGMRVVIPVVGSNRPGIVLLGCHLVHRVGIPGSSGNVVRVLSGSSCSGVGSVGILGSSCCGLLLGLSGLLLGCLLLSSLLLCLGGFLAVVSLLVVVISLVDGVHSVVLVCLAFVVLFFLGIELFPGSSNQPCDGASFRRNSKLGLLQTQDVGTEKHVVSRFVSLAISSLVGRLVLGHLFIVSFSI